ncbi:uncharacterized protein BDZ83DRAFT_16296 [Colletotrichum acutatum]|uniref:Secreted protein n=1 Tax=Glomerella acutata TaxID=27357 RepID=A0AAD9D096_GLOAC|nr:uncharacterized protein BDZ83DRAFT_16296 [Colletotrichum acutatum]KAK1729757.1 hypothetical protein BDZ83DRAFT_16296 [Colletotrichum acutatum]
MQLGQLINLILVLAWRNLFLPTTNPIALTENRVEFVELQYLISSVRRIVENYVTKYGGSVSLFLAYHKKGKKTWQPSSRPQWKNHAAQSVSNYMVAAKSPAVRSTEAHIQPTPALQRAPLVKASHRRCCLQVPASHERGILPQIAARKRGSPTCPAPSWTRRVQVLFVYTPSSLGTPVGAELGSRARRHVGEGKDTEYGAWGSGRCGWATETLKFDPPTTGPLLGSPFEALTTVPHHTRHMVVFAQLRVPTLHGRGRNTLEIWRGASSRPIQFRGEFNCPRGVSRK